MVDWAVIKGRTTSAAAALRQKLTWRRVGLAMTATISVALLAVTTEALFRAHLGDPGSRLPTALYSRTVPWNSPGTHVAPVAIGTISGSPLEERIPLALHDIPARVIQAVIAVEDQRFYQHHGIDIRRIGGAFVANVRAGGIVQGGSTLTQQLAKNLFLTADRTPLRKLREAAMAIVLELRYDKPAILDAYLNEIYLGQDGPRAIHGVGAASRYYLGKDIRRVTLAEAAQLAAMISAPNRTEPTRHPEAAHDRRNIVLQLMVDQNRISATSAASAEDDDITAGNHAQPVFDGRYFRDFAAANVTAHLPPRGMAVYTSLDANLQRAAEHAVDNGLDRLSASGAQAALIAIDPRTGEVLAMVGGRDYGASQFNRAIDAHRQPGSAFKPIVALAALAPVQGKSPQFTLASAVEDEPLSVETPHGAWQPVDYDQSYRGEVTVREAMEQSLNIPFARIGLAVGPARIADVARQVGITSTLDKVPSLALGSSDVTLLEMVRSYGVLATSGELARPRVIEAHGEYGHPAAADGSMQSAAVFDPAVTYLVTSALQGVVERGTGRALGSDSRFEGLAGKTGTSNNWRDAWFIAYSPTLVVGVWVGYDDGRSLHLTGSAAALPIVAGFLRQITPEDGWPAFAVPNGITQGYANAVDGDMSLECDQREVFLEGTAPSGGGCDTMDTPDLHDLGNLRGIGSAVERGLARLARELLQHRGDILRARGGWNR
ncbi:MAG: transglycosylase domain-containing protein [Casimicrobiaceae bacterium]